MKIKSSTKKDKRLMAIFNDGKIIHFGSKNGSVYTDHKDKKKRENYLKRHRVNEDWTKINPASLSRFILWGDSTSIDTNIANYKRMFNL